MKQATKEWIDEALSGRRDRGREGMGATDAQAAERAVVSGARTTDAQVDLRVHCVACGAEREPHWREDMREAHCVVCGAIVTPFAVPKRIECWRIRPVEGGAWLYETKLANLVDLIEHETSECHAFTLEKTSLTEEEANAMGEFDGW